MTGRYFDPDVIHRKIILTADQHDLLCRILDRVVLVDTADPLGDGALAEELRKLKADVENCYDALAPDHDELEEGIG